MEGQKTRGGRMEKIKSHPEVLKMKVTNFLAIKKAELISQNNLTLLIAPNKAGKTHLLMLIYCIFWSLWRAAKEDNSDKKIVDVLKSKMKKTFLIKSLDELVSWEEESYKIEVEIDKKVNLLIFAPPFKAKLSKTEEKKLHRSLNISPINISPIYIQPAGMGIYYKGIYSMKKYYSDWRLISEAITDFLNDLFIVSEKDQITEDSKKLLDLFEELFVVKFYVQQGRIYVKEKRNYIIEKAASGLQTLSWFYLAIKYGLLGEVVLIDEPEANLHPEYIDKLSAFLVRLSKRRKVFVATHSDYLLVSLNKQILKKNLKIDVWIGKLGEKGAIYTAYQADRENLIDTSPLSNVYMYILRESFGYET